VLGDRHPEHLTQALVAVVGALNLNAPSVATEAAPATSALSNEPLTDNRG
jgi:hypothetical protein